MIDTDDHDSFIRKISHRYDRGNITEPPEFDETPGPPVHGETHTRKSADDTVIRPPMTGKMLGAGRCPCFILRNDPPAAGQAERDNIGAPGRVSGHYTEARIASVNKMFF